MTEVIELKLGTADYDIEAMCKFEDTGTIGADVLNQCWEKHLGTNVDMVFGKILNILEAFFLLCPYLQPEDEPPLYLVPSALPARTDESIPFVNEGYMYKFYFEFPQYLPEEVYTHLVCLFLSLLRKTESPREPMITSTSCKFFSISKYNWKVTLLAAKQQLEVQARFVLLNAYFLIMLFFLVGVQTLALLQLKPFGCLKSSFCLMSVAKIRAFLVL